MRKMLVVDDEIEICEFLKIFFQDRDFDVRTAYSGDEAIKVLGKLDPDVVLLDIHMPGMSGLNVLKEMKQLKPDLKVIMVTAIETNDKIEEAMRLGADNYITKPLSLEYLEKDVQDKVSQVSRRLV